MIPPLFCSFRDVATKPIPALLLALAFSFGGRATADEAKQLEFFESKIRPVLVKHCYECHSADSDEAEGGLMLDTAAGLLRGGDSGPSLVAGEPDKSLLLEALRYESVEMPPEGRLDDEVIADFEKWIEMGAVDPRAGGENVHVAGRRTIDIEKGREFWAFQPPKMHDVPEVKDRQWSQRAIDAFIYAKLKENGLQPAPPADRATLVRRLYYDLIGLPPTAEQLQAALADNSPQAIEKLVDQLLASKEFGVHWGRHWLDVARYADSNGGDFNATFHNAWRYRDYVIKAMNEDKPFDQFVREQIAGDLLPSNDDAQRTEQMIATGFLMLGTKMLSERDKDKLRMDVVDEQIDTLGRTFLGMTLGCARCHDHKFDPIPTHDYYALAGIFRSTRTLEGESQKYVSTWRKSELPTSAEHAAALAKHAEEVKQVKSELDVAKKELARAEKALSGKLIKSNHLTVDDSQAEVAGAWKASTYSPLFVGKGYIHDDQADKGEKSVEYTAKLPKSGLYEVRMSYTPGPTRASNVPVVVKHAEGETEVPFDQRPAPPIDKMFGVVGQFQFEKDKPASVTIFTTGTQGYVIADAVQFVELDKDGKPVSNSQLADDGMLREMKAQIETHKSAVKELGEKLKKVEADSPPPLPRAIAASDYDQPADCEIRIRGEHRNKGDMVPRGYLQVAMTSNAALPAKDESGRRELANWIASSENPLTGRVIVNRVWSHLLGEGIVRSVDNFGQLGQRPTHPELLDHLTMRFTASPGSDGMGWSIKNLVREIVLSQTYQMASQHDDAAWEKDPENRLLWRANRKRLPAEAIRDGMLSISGQLDPSPGKSPVAGLGVLVNNNNADAEEYEAESSSKRSVYLPIIRNELPALLTVFDFADPDLVVGKRPVTNVPAQSLLLMNSPFVMDCADKTAKQILSEKPSSNDALIEGIYQTILARAPLEVEKKRALEFLSADEQTMPSDKRVAMLVHVIFASAEFRMLD